MKYKSKNFNNLKEAVTFWKSLNSKLPPIYSFSKKSGKNGATSAQIVLEIKGNDQEEFKKVRAPMGFEPI